MITAYSNIENIKETPIVSLLNVFEDGVFEDDVFEF